MQAMAGAQLLADTAWALIFLARRIGGPEGLV